MKVRGIPLPLSQSCRDVNPQLGVEKARKHLGVPFTVSTDKNAVAGRSCTRVGLRCGMNKTESEYAMILEAQKRAGEILRYEFEGITLRFANVSYTPDFVVVESKSITGYARTKFIEVKGPFIKGNRERAVERFRHAKTYWPEFTFEMWQKKDGSWRQII